ncbi:MAG: hypothetical protein CM1200mP10_25340 [Candidatus Neomarinimicrobiota bacterium]|nr:MAG: hypothetical protein CM1200mP10_25340 [Candidatus Neomarinimicrobiota bacterium]
MGLHKNSDFNRWLLLAGNLRKESQYDLSIKAYQELLHLELELPPKIIGEALLGLGKKYEDQLLPKNRNNSLVGFYPDNLFFKNEFLQISPKSRESLERTFELYKRVLQELPASSFSPKAHFRLGEIQFKITRDFDGARLHIYLLYHHVQIKIFGKMFYSALEILLSRRKFKSCP